MDDPLRVKGLLIDMDGLLLDTERVAERCWCAAERETGFNMPPGFYYTLIGLSMPLIHKRLTDVMDPACDTQQFISIAKARYAEALNEDRVPLKTGAAGFLEFLEQRKIPRCLATSTYSELCHHKLAAAGLERLLPLRVCGDEVTSGKPDPEIFSKAAAKLGHSPGDLLALEDSGNGLRAALAAGCRVAHIPDLAPVELALQAKAHRIFRDLIELQAALQMGEIIIEN